LRNVKTSARLLRRDTVLHDRVSMLVRDETPPVARMTGVSEVVERAMYAVWPARFRRAVSVNREPALKKGSSVFDRRWSEGRGAHTAPRHNDYESQ